MKEIQQEIGRRPYLGDDFLTIFEENMESAMALLKDCPNCILSGCIVSVNADRHDVSAGLVWIDNRIMRFAGATYYVLPAEIVAATPVATEKVYETGAVGNTYVDYRATIRAATGSGSRIDVTVDTRVDFWSVLKTKIDYASKADVSALDALTVIVNTKIGQPAAWKYIGVDDGTSFASTWINDVTFGSNARYRITAPNKVALGGVVRNTTPTSALFRIFQLPVGYRPSVKLNLGIRGASYGQIESRFYFITVDIDGWVNVYLETQTNQGLMVALDGIEFYLN